jgi:hypothetical protein
MRLKKNEEKEKEEARTGNFCAFDMRVWGRITW